VKATLFRHQKKERSSTLPLFFIVAYLAQGVAQQFGLIAQPLQNFLMKERGMDAAQTAAFLSVLMLPWVIKPLYGVLSDFVPLFGYRRKSYLCLSI